MNTNNIARGCFPRNLVDQENENPQHRLFAALLLHPTVPSYFSSFNFVGDDGTAGAAEQALPCVMTIHCASMFVRVFHCYCRPKNNERENQANSGALVATQRCIP